MLLDCKKLAAAMALVCSLQMAMGQRISYIVSFPNLAHHERLFS